MTIESHGNGGYTITGEKSMNVYRAIVLKAALSLYAKTGMLATRQATPMQMLKIAEEYTGIKYKRGQHEQALLDVTKWIEDQKK